MSSSSLLKWNNQSYSKKGHVKNLFLVLAGAFIISKKIGGLK